MSARLANGCYLGRVLVCRQWEGICLTQTRHVQNDWLPTHAHQNAYFCFVRSGEFTERFGNQVRHCKPTMLIFHPPEEQHSERIVSPTSSSFNIELDQNWLRRVTACQPLQLQPTVMSGGEWTNIVLQLHREFQQPDQVSSLAIQGLVLQLLAGLSRSRKTRKPFASWLNRVQQLLNDRFMEQLDTSELATEAGVHPVYLVQSFRKHIGCTPGEYQRRLRINWAGEQLQNTSNPIAEIALRAGFADQSHLTRHFKRQTGVTPRAYRHSALT